MANSFKNSYVVQEKQMTSLSVYNVGYQQCTPGYQWGPGIRDHYLIHYIVSGCGSYQIYNQTWELNAGDMFLAYPHTEITYTADVNQPWEYYWAGFSGSDASTILNMTEFTKKQPIIKQSPLGSQIKENLLHIYQCRGNEFLNAVEMTGRLYIMLSLLIHQAEPASSRDISLTYVQKAMEYISYYYSYQITVEDIAEYVGISRSHLFRAFQQQLEQSPKQYLTAFRIKQACLLLTTTSLSIASVAASVGYEDSLYFSKVFHKEKGIPPTQYALKKHK